MTARVRDEAARRRFELEEAGETAIAAYEEAGGVITFTHTVVPEALRGRGVGGRLVAGALAEVRRRGLKVVPACSFVAAYMAEHAEVRDLLAARSG